MNLHVHSLSIQLNLDWYQGFSYLFAALCFPEREVHDRGYVCIYFPGYIRRNMSGDTAPVNLMMILLTNISAFLQLWKLGISFYSSR